MSDAETTRPRARPLDPMEAALGAQLERLDRVAVRGLQILTLGGAILGVGVGIALSARLGFSCAAASAALFGWYLLLGQATRKRPPSPPLRTIALMVESSMPWLFLVVIAAREGALYAVASWVPPMIFCALIIANLGRLRPGACLLLGLVSAVAYPAVYLLFVRDLVPTEQATLLVLRPSLQLTRAASLGLAGCLAALVARGMLRAIFRAESVVREQDLFGKYRLTHRIASGGMGMVFEALYCPEGGFERRVAVKRIHPHLAAEPKFVAAFRDEAELSARLAHPGIVQVLDFGRVGDSFFLAMEFVDGMTLNALVFRLNERKQRLSPSVVGHVLREMLGALAYAHEGARGSDGRPLRVVHRDLCPPNVLVSKNGEVKLTDFGIARSLSDAATSMTQNVAGHAGYMAPEQARAEAFDTRADLFPVGVMAWELLTLRPLFRRENETQSLMALLADEVLPVTVERADIDGGWTDWISRAIARDPEERFASATEMLAALDRIPDSHRAGAAEELSRIVRDLSSSKGTSEPTDEVPTQVDSRPGAAAEVRSPD